MNADELRQTIGRTEGIKLDFKREYKLNKTPSSGSDKQLWKKFVEGQWHEFIKDILALTNGNVGTANQSGMLIIGVDDHLQPDGTRELHDTDFLQLTDEQIVQKVNNACDPPIPDIRCERVEVDGKNILVITIPPSPHIHDTTCPLTTQKGEFDNTGQLRFVKQDKTYNEQSTFIRRGSTTALATNAERQAIKKERNLQFYSTSQKPAHNYKEETSVTIPVKHVETKKETFRDCPPVIHIFVGRENDIQKLLNPQIRVAAITGLGGEGKSTLAAKIYEMAANGTILQFAKLGWSDCKDLDSPFHEKLLSLLEELTDGKQTKQKYCDENIDDTILRFISLLNKENCLVIFDNIDAFVDNESWSFIGKIKILFDNLISKLSRSLVIFTCRSAINDYHFSFLEIPIKGLSYTEALELAQGFDISNTDAWDLKYIHQNTKGHALWLNLIFAQIRSERINIDKLHQIISTQTDILDVHILNSIWSTLRDKEKEIIWTIGTFTRPHDVRKIESVSKISYHKCIKLLTSLVKLRLVLKINVAGETHYDLHPIIRMKAKSECKPQKKHFLLKRAFFVLSFFGNWNRLDAIVSMHDSYTADMDSYVECAEVALENRDFKRAIEYVAKVADPLLKYGEDAKFIQLCQELFKELKQDEIEIEVHSKISKIYESFINALLGQGEFKKVNNYLLYLNNTIKSFQQYIFYCGLNGYNLWFQNDFNEAIKFIEETIERIKEKGESVPPNMYYNLALSKRDYGKVDEALQFFFNKIELENIESWDPDSGNDISADVGNIGRCYYLQGKFERSLALYKKSVEFLQKGQSRANKVNYGYGLLWLADVYIKLEEFTEATKYVKQAVDVWGKYCPSRLKKIQNHIREYPQAFKNLFPSDFLDSYE